MSRNEFKKPNITEDTKKPKVNEIVKKDQYELTKHVPYLLFLLLFLVLYIYNTHHAEKKIRQSEKLKKEVKELYSEYVTLQSDILNQSRQTQLEIKLASKGIKPSKENVILIKK